jgi:hypothetical protein|tara:strand:- start:18630 stop:18875 length:246 start_codon:yes stop_codon:yes gene_type:complete
MTDREQLNLTQFDYVMAAVNEYVQERNVDKNMLWNIIEHVQDGTEFIAAMTAQSNLMEIVENHNIMRQYHKQIQNEFYKTK